MGSGASRPAHVRRFDGALVDQQIHYAEDGAQRGAAYFPRKEHASSANANAARGKFKRAIRTNSDSPRYSLERQLGKSDANCRFKSVPTMLEQQALYQARLRRSTELLERKSQLVRSDKLRDACKRYSEWGHPAHQLHLAAQRNEDVFTNASLRAFATAGSEAVREDLLQYGVERCARCRAWRLGSRRSIASVSAW